MDFLTQSLNCFQERLLIDEELHSVIELLKMMNMHL